MSNHADLVSFIIDQFSTRGFQNAQSFVEYILEEGKAIVLYDGLDEVNQENNQRSKLTRLLSNFCTTYPKTLCFITCRVGASEYQFPNFRDVEIADFTDVQISTFVTKWFADDRKKCDAFFEEFNKPENSRLKETASVPLMLSTLCLFIEDNMKFPSQCSTLYGTALDALLNKWDASRNIQRSTLGVVHFSWIDRFTLLETERTFIFSDFAGSQRENGLI
ncbi:NACHT domain-containing protein [Chloroflexi bacterium TSY]|nr:NACHT domain-containing protein [Chloroflexi bacterium TSY]